MAERTGKDTGRGDFFAIDRRILTPLFDLGMNAVVSYLLLARGTRADMRTTSWSVNSIEAYTAISRSRAKEALGKLVDRGLLRQIKTEKAWKGSARFFIAPADEIAGSGCEPPPEPNEWEKAKLREINSGWTSTPAPRRKSFRELVEKRLAEHDGEGRFRPLAYAAAAAAVPVWIWLPNDICDGTGMEVSPIEYVRQTASLPTLRLLLELYVAHDLQGAGGVHWRSLRQNYKREQMGKHGAWTTWKFTPGTDLAWPNKPPAKAFMTGTMETVEGQARDKGWPIFWDALRRLERLGLVQRVPHLIESDSDAGALVHPCPGPDDAGEAGEREIGRAAHRAALAMTGEDFKAGLDRALERKGGLLVPVQNHREEAVMFGIYRLRYRARTGATAAWLADSAKWAEWVERFEGAERKVREREEATMSTWSGSA